MALLRLLAVGSDQGSVGVLFPQLSDGRRLLEVCNLRMALVFTLAWLALRQRLCQLLLLLLVSQPLEPIALETLRRVFVSLLEWDVFVQVLLVFLTELGHPGLIVPGNGLLPDYQFDQKLVIMRCRNHVLGFCLHEIMVGLRRHPDIVRTASIQPLLLPVVLLFGEVGLLQEYLRYGFVLGVFLWFRFAIFVLNFWIFVGAIPLA